jgi:hypothetical protein
MLANRIMAIWLMAVWSGAVVMFSFPVPRIYRLNAHHGETIAHVTGKDCANHNGAFYAYAVEGVRYSGDDMMPFSCDEMLMDKEVPIYFDLNDPGVSTTGEPYERLVHATIALLAVGVMGVFLCIKAVRPLWIAQKEILWRH